VEKQVFTSSYRRDFHLKVGCGLILALSLSGLGLYLYLSRPFGGDYLLAIAELDRLQQTISWAVAVSVTLQLVVFSLLLYLGSLFWTHKVAGPLYRLKMTFIRLAEGDWTPMYQVRKGDQLKEIPGLLNHGLEAVCAIDDAIKSELVEVEGRLQELPAGAGDGQVITETRNRLIRLLDKHWPM
jgi:signal transduction histidine kinase